MPCDTVRNVTMSLDNIVSEDVLKRGLEAAGFTVQEYGSTIVASKGWREVRISKGRATVRQGDEALVNEVKQAYAKEAWNTAAKKFGASAWNLKQDTDNPNRLIMKPRY